MGVVRGDHDRLFGRYPDSVFVLTHIAPGSYTPWHGIRGVAQSVARGVWDAEVGGSSPLTPTRFARASRTSAARYPSRLSILTP